MLIERKRPPKPAWKWPDGKQKPRLRAAHLQHYRVHYADLEEYLGLVYRQQDFDFFKASRVTPGMVPEYDITGALPPSWDVRQRAERIRNGQRSGDIPLILNILCLDGFIPAGRYWIDTKPRTEPIELYRALLKTHGDPQHRECVKFRECHRSDKDFTKKAATLDNAIAEWLRNQQ